MKTRHVGTDNKVETATGCLIGAARAKVLSLGKRAAEGARKERYQWGGDKCGIHVYRARISKRAEQTSESRDRALLRQLREL